MIADRVFHPFLLGVYLVLGLLAGNLGETHLEEAWRALIVLPVTTGLVVLAARPILGNGHAAGVALSAAIVLAFTHSTLLDVALELAPESVVANVFWVVVVLEAGLFAAATRLVARYAAECRSLTPLLNIAAGVLVLMPLLEIALYGSRGGAILAGDPAEADDLPPIALKRPLDEPDIYYIVLDGYARSDTLREFHGGDNSKFVEALRERGFFVAARSHSNYLSTKLVLPSVLNLDYLGHVAELVGTQSRDTGPLVSRILHNRAVSALAEIGYRIVSITTGISYVALAEPDEAIRLERAGLMANELESALARMTPIPELLDRIAPTRPASTAATHRRRVEYAIEKLAAQGRAPGPKFVFAHIASPHDPFVFGADGEPRGIYLQLFRDYPANHVRFLARAYAAQIEHLNGLVLATIDAILADSNRPPVIVVQGDHGLRLFLKRRIEDSCLRESFAILNALHLPGADPKLLYDTVSPVNTFRMIFDEYFDTDLGLLEDRAIFAHRYGYYDFRDVTDSAETCTTRSQLPIKDGR